MGLDTTHDAWHGAYSAFMRWRKKIAEVAGSHPLGLMEGFFERGDYQDPIKDYAEKIYNMRKSIDAPSPNVDDIYAGLPIRWKAIRPSPLHELLHHSDCDGHIPWGRCAKIADCLEVLLPKLEEEPNDGGHIGNYADKTRQFIKGLRAAHAAKEKLGFH